MTPEFPQGFERILFTEEQIEQRIGVVAAEISERYKDKDLKLIGVLKGSVFFLSALARRITIPLKIDFLAISSFSNKSMGNVAPQSCVKRLICSVSVTGMIPAMTGRSTPIARSRATKR